MKSKVSSWFEIKVKSEKVQEDGSSKKVAEIYIVEADTFTEAESGIIKYAEEFGLKEVGIVSIKRANFSEIFFSDEGSDDTCFKIKVAFTSIDEKTEKEKRYCINYLVQGSSIDKAKLNFKEAFEDTMADYIIQSIAETPIINIIQNV